MNIAVQLTHTDFANALSGLANSVKKPRFLSDVLEIKQARGDDDIAFFKLQCRMFQSRFGATIEGAYRNAKRHGGPAWICFAEMLEEFM